LGLMSPYQGERSFSFGGATNQEEVPPLIKKRILPEGLIRGKDQGWSPVYGSGGKGIPNLIRI